MRQVGRQDYVQWRPLWDGYNAFYGREGATALPEAITEAHLGTLLRTRGSPCAASSPEEAGALVGLTHYIFHRSTTRLDDICYLQDLYTQPQLRGKGIGRRLIMAVYAAAKARACTRVYWQTQTGNAAGRLLYDKLAAHLGFIVYSHEL